ncbi:MAG TPA: pitrilysin family protein [Thermomicrobiales bacterium]|nr:pitrilysin family protein [Thermomicrobiales bacterium]
MPDPVSGRRIISLDNGLTLFLQEKHDAPVASFWVWYRVGSRNEMPGQTGVSHWVEHMQFKGTSSIAKGSIFRDVSRIGGQLNAMTSMDWTAYYETIPAAELDLSLRIESDRMSNSLFDPPEVDSERTVILSERQGAENRPTYHLYEELIGAAFQSHPYSHSVIGYERDLRRMSREDLFNHYRRYYRPSNAFITAVGDFDADDLASRINASFGSIPNNDMVIPDIAPDVPQYGERRVTIRKPSAAAYMMMGYKLPDAKHPDMPAILVADALLSGGKAMGLGGGGVMGRSSRLYRALVSKGLARSAGSSASLYRDSYLWDFTATALPGVEPAAIEAAVDAEIERLKNEIAGEEEFVKARKQSRAQYIYSQETATSQAFWLGQMEIVDHAGRVDTLADELAAVTPEDVQRVARTWLVPEQRTIGWQLPDDGIVSAGVDIPDAALVEPFARTVCGFSGEEVSSHGFVRTVLPNGIIVLAQPRPGDQAIDGAIEIQAGHAATGDTTPGLASMTGSMLNRGTSNRSFDEYNEEVDGLGAIIGVSTSRDSMEIGWHSLAEDLEHVLGIAADIILNPTFPEDELEKVRKQALTGLKEQEQDTGAMAAKALRELMYPEGHPYRIPTSGEIASVEAIGRQDLVDYHAKHLGPTATTIALVGGVADLEAAVASLEQALGSWTNLIPQPHEVASIEPPATTVQEAITVRGRSQADITIGYPTIPRDHPEYYALQVANLILGQLGLMGRLGAHVRDEQGLAYYAYSSLTGGKANSVWGSRAGVDPGNIGRALEGIERELRTIRKEHVSDEELADAKSYLIGSLPLGLESLGGVTDLLLTLERHKLGLDYLDRYPEIISALTKDDLLGAAATHIDPDRLAIGIAGPESVQKVVSRKLIQSF